MLTLRRPAPIEVQPTDPLAELLEHSPTLRALDAHLDDIFAREFEHLDPIVMDPMVEAPEQNNSDSIDAGTTVENADFDVELAKLVAEESAKADVIAAPDPITLQQPTIELPQLDVIDTTPATRVERKQRQGVRKHISLGSTAMVLGLAAGSFFMASNLESERPKLSPAPAAEAPDLTTTTPSSAPEPSAAATVELAPEAPIVPFEAEVGDVIGVLNIHAICEEIQVVEYNGLERINKIIGTGDAVIDQTLPDPSPNTGCATVDERESEMEAALGRDVMRRTERTRDSLKSPENPDGKVDVYQPIGGHQQNPDGVYGSPFPGQDGNTVFAFHGSTFNAAGADFPFLREGDTATFERKDKKVFHYRLVGIEYLDPEDPEPFYYYSHPDSSSTMTTFICASANGETGDDEIRLALRWVMTGSAQAQA